MQDRGAKALIKDDRATREKVYTYARSGCSVSEIASYLGVGRTTLFAAFERSPQLRKYFRQGQTHMVMELRQAQIEVAKDPDHRGQGAMLIHLGKTVCGQGDRPAVTERPIPGEEATMEANSWSDLADKADFDIPGLEEDPDPSEFEFALQEGEK